MPQVTLRGVLPPVSFDELNQSLKDSLLPPAGTKSVAFAELVAAVQNSLLPPAGTKSVAFAELVATVQESLLAPAGTNLAQISDLDDFHFRGVNPANVTVTSGLTTLVSLSLNLPVGSIVFIFGDAGINKGATGGASNLVVGKLSGAGDISIAAFNSTTAEFLAHPASTGWDAFVSAVGIITVAGAIDFRLFAGSLGSNSTVFANGSGLRIFAIRN